MKQWLSENWIVFAPVAAVLVFISSLLLTVVVQSRHPEITVADQRPIGGSIVIKRAFLPSNGFVAIHTSDAKGALVPSSSIGHARLEAGLNFDVRVRLSQKVPSGTKVYAVVHRDTGNVGRYEFGEVSPPQDPMALVDGKPAAASFAVE